MAVKVRVTTREALVIVQGLPIGIFDVEQWCSLEGVLSVGAHASGGAVMVDIACVDPATINAKLSAWCKARELELEK